MTPPASSSHEPTPDDGPSPGLIAQARDAWGRPEGRAAIVGGGVCAGLLAASFWPTLRQLVHVWTTDDNYSHGFLVPFIGLYFANEAARRGRVPIRSGVVPGAALLTVAMLGRLATVAVPVGIVGDLSFLLGLAGVVSLMAGAGALRRYAFALGFLVFMVPLPVALYARIASPLQLSVSQIASALLNATGVPVLCEGNMMTLPGDVRMFVAEACSGMRQLTGFLALTTAVAYLTTRPAWHRAALVASAIPVAMTANVTRVTLTGWIMSFNPKYAAGAFHTVEGLLMMGLGLSMLAAECWALNRLADLGTRAPASPPSPSPSPSPSPVARPDAGRPVPDGGGAMSSARRAALGVAILTLGLGAQAALERATETGRPPLSRPLATLPMRLGDWVGRDEPVDADVLRESQADDHLNRVYEDRRHPGRRLTLWLNYSEHGLNLRHSPEVCLPSGGWTKVESQCQVLVMRCGETTTPVSRLSYSKGELVQRIGFWYYIFGEGRLERYVRTLPITCRSSHGRATRGSGLTVEVFAPGEADPDGESLRDFAEALLAELGPILPGDRAQYHLP